MSKNNFVPIEYIPMNNIINYDNEIDEKLLNDDIEEGDNDIVTDSYIYGYLD